VSASVYRERVLEHYKRPRNFGELDPSDLAAHESNPLCGDELGVHLRVRDGHIAELRFHGLGCAISQAAASLASERYLGMSLAEVSELDGAWALEPLGGPVSASRRRCGALHLRVMRAAVGAGGWPAGVD
jgi:nitrogen fixation protein NifU and related proteins